MLQKAKGRNYDGLVKEPSGRMELTDAPSLCGDVDYTRSPLSLPIAVQGLIMLLDCAPTILEPVEPY